MGKIRLSSKSSDLNYPSLKPTLNLNFAASKSLDPRITFTRNSTGTYVGSDGLIKTAVENEPRFEHDPVTGQCLGLLIEESRTNLIRNSQNITAGTWAGGSSSTPNPLVYEKYVDTSTTILAPDGISRVPFVSLGDRGQCYETINFAQNTTVTLSFYARRDPRYSGGSIRAVIGGNLFDFNSLLFNDRWARITYTAQATPGFNPIGIYQLVITNTYRGIYLWGFQCEVGDYATSYIPTSGSTVTRAADNASITGTNFTDWYSSTGGTLIFNGKQNTSKITSNTLSITPDYYQDKNLVSSILYYPRSIDYSTLKALNLNSYTNILTNGLLVYLDVANSKSYPGYGTILNGLANSGITGTLLNGVSYDSANGGSLVFNGINQYCNTDFTLNNLNTNVTIGCWIKTSVTQLCGVFGLRTSATIRPWEQFQFYISGDADSITSGQYINYNEFSIDSGNVTTQRNIFVNTTSITTGNWVNIVATSDSTKSIVYINGVAVGQNTNSNRPQRTSEATLRIGGAGDWSQATPLAILNGYYFNGSFSNGFIYNRALSAAEIQQNFNATRSLFGV